MLSVPKTTTSPDLCAVCFSTNLGKPATEVEDAYNAQHHGRTHAAQYAARTHKCKRTHACTHTHAHAHDQTRTNAHAFDRPCGCEPRQRIGGLQAARLCCCYRRLRSMHHACTHGCRQGLAHLSSSATWSACSCSHPLCVLPRYLSRMPADQRCVGKRIAWGRTQRVGLRMA